MLHIPMGLTLRLGNQILALFLVQQPLKLQAKFYGTMFCICIYISYVSIHMVLLDVCQSFMDFSKASYVQPPMVAWFKTKATRTVSLILEVRFLEGRRARISKMNLLYCVLFLRSQRRKLVSVLSWKYNTSKEISLFEQIWLTKSQKWSPDSYKTLNKIVSFATMKHYCFFYENQQELTSIFVTFFNSSY